MGSKYWYSRNLVFKFIFFKSIELELNKSSIFKTIKFFIQRSVLNVPTRYRPRKTTSNVNKKKLYISLSRMLLEQQLKFEQLKPFIFIKNRRLPSWIYPWACKLIIRCCFFMINTFKIPMVEFRCPENKRFDLNITVGRIKHGTGNAIIRRLKWVLKFWRICMHHGINSKTMYP